MPTYDYECEACQHTFEEWQSFKDEPLTKCPACKKKKLRRLFGGGAAIIFKGSGFYETDYRKDSYTEAAKKDAEAAKSSSESSSEAKPPADSSGSAKSESKSSTKKAKAES